MFRVIEGEYEVFLDGKTYTATAGAVVNFPRSVVHAFRNTGAKPARSLFITTPGENFERFMHELSAVAPTAPADVAKVEEVMARYGLPIVEIASTINSV